MKRLLSFLMIMGLCSGAFADSKDLRIVSTKLKSATDDTLLIIVAPAETVYTKNLPNKTSNSSSFIFKATSGGTVDTAITRQHRPAGGSWTDFNAISTLSATGTTVVTTDTLAAYNDTRLKLVGGAGQTAGTYFEIWEGRK